MSKNDQALPFVLFGAVVALIVSVKSFQYGGQFGLLGGSVLSYMLVGLLASLRWPLNASRIGVIAVIPSIVFIAWHWFKPTSPEDASLNTSFLVFLPALALSASYFGGFIGRSIVVKRMKRAHQQAEK
jgi:hypothetical protein